MSIFNRKPPKDLPDLLDRIWRDEARKELLQGTLRELGILAICLAIAGIAAWRMAHHV